jgi:hypothetical protein
VEQHLRLFDAQLLRVAHPRDRDRALPAEARLGRQAQGQTGPAMSSFVFRFSVFRFFSFFVFRFSFFFFLRNICGDAQAPIESLPSIRLIGEIPKLSVHLAKEYVLDILTVTKTIFQQTNHSATQSSNKPGLEPSTASTSTRPISEASPSKNAPSGDYEVMKSMKNSAYKRKNSYASGASSDVECLLFVCELFCLAYLFKPVFSCSPPHPLENLPDLLPHEVNTAIETTQLKLEFIIHEMEVIIDHAPIASIDAEPIADEYELVVVVVCCCRLFVVVVVVCLFVCLLLLLLLLLLFSSSFFFLVHSFISSFRR